MIRFQIVSKKMPKGRFLFLLFSVALLLIFSSCAGRDDKEPGVEKLEFWTISLQPTYNDYINGLISEFEKSQPGVKVEWVDVPINAVKQKLLATIAGGVPPDVVNLNSEFAQTLAQNYALINMDSVVPAEVKARYFEGLWNAAGFRGSNYAIPWYVTTRIIMYNREIFVRAGYKPGDYPKTWDQVGEYARRIRERTGIYGYMPAVKFVEDLQIRGIPVVNEERNRAVFDSPRGVHLLDWFTELYRTGVFPAETLTEGYQGALNRFQSGQMAMIIAGPTLLKRLEKDSPAVYRVTEVAPLPLGEAKVIPASTMNLAVPVGSKKHRLAVEFALFVTDEANQLEFCKLAPLLPSTRKTAESDFFRSDTGNPLQDRARFISIRQLYQARDMSLGLPHITELNQSMNEAVERSFYGKATPRQALKGAVEKWNEILSR